MTGSWFLITLKERVAYWGASSLQRKLLCRKAINLYYNNNISYHVSHIELILNGLCLYCAYLKGTSRREPLEHKDMIFPFLPYRKHFKPSIDSSWLGLFTSPDLSMSPSLESSVVGPLKPLILLVKNSKYEQSIQLPLVKNTPNRLATIPLLSCIQLPQLTASINPAASNPKYLGTRHQLQSRLKDHSNLANTMDLSGQICKARIGSSVHNWQIIHIYIYRMH